MRLLQILTNSEAIRAQDSDVVSEFLKILENLDNLQIESYLVSRLVSVLYVMSQGKWEKNISIFYMYYILASTFIIYIIF